jgi:pimeloyl-ACP methyl ester carboxylesterase
MLEDAMFGFLTVLALQIASCDGGKTDPVISAVEFAAYFDAARTGRLSIPDEALEEAQRYRYVFVGGFHNERLPGYFTQNAKELRAKGVSKGAIHFIYPSSHETVAGNARAVREQFEDIACEGPEKLVVIAHSRGSCDALAFALQNPEFVAENIHALFLIQGPFGGTALADYVVGEGPPVDNRMPLGHRVVAHVVAKAEGYLLNHGKHGGLPALTRRASEEFWQDMLKESSAAIPIVSPKTFYITSQIPPSGHRFVQRAIASYLEVNLGENDGVVALEDQSLLGLGTVLAVLDAGHTDLTNRFPSGRAAQRMRKAVIDAIIMGVGEQKAADSRKRKSDAGKSSGDERTSQKGRANGSGRR